MSSEGDAAPADGPEGHESPTAARPIWTGSISFGLVNIPIRLYPATRSHQPAFHQFDAKTMGRIRYKRVIEGTDEEIPYAQIVDGYEIKKGEIVTLTDDEMEAAEPKKSRSLDIEQFVPLTQIDPITWNHTYYVVPDSEAGPRKAYAVLRDAMEQMGRVAIGRLVMRSKQYLATVRPFAAGLALETMFFADEIRPFPQIAGGQKLAAGSTREVDMAKKLIEAFADPWRHEKYEDTYRERLVALIKKKARGQTVEVAPPPAAAEGKVIDLMDALKRSLGGKDARPVSGRAAKKGLGARTPTSVSREPKGKPRSRKRAAA